MIQMSSPDISAAEREAVAAVMLTPNLSMGKEILAFEDAFRQRLGCSNAIGVSSGTAGLHLCLRAAGIGDNNLVITTPYSFVASTNVILYERAIPVYVDVDEKTGNIDTQQACQAISDVMAGGKAVQRWLPRKGAAADARLKGVLTADVFGQPVDIDPILDAARQHDLRVIDDSCEALGATYKNRPAGLLGDYGVFAFYPNKQITTGEGGMIVTNRTEDADFTRALRNQGRAPGDTWLQHTYLGYNYRLDELSAALGRVQMSRLDELLEKRQQVASWYDERLDRIAGIECPYIAPTTTKVSWFVYVIRFDPGIDRERVAQALAEYNIPTRPYFMPIHLQTYMRQQFGYREGDFPVAERLGQCSLALPFSGVMTEEAVDTVCRTIQQVI